MKDNKHPHHDLLSELISDTSKQVQMITCRNSVINVMASNVISDTKGIYNFRIKPREFIKGHWYPCLHEERRFICCFDGAVLLEPINKGYKAISVTWDAYSCCGLKVGKSLGEIKFNG